MRPANKCNGMVYDADGNLLVCEHVTSLARARAARRHARDDRLALPRQGAATARTTSSRARTGRSTSATRGSAACRSSASSASTSSTSRASTGSRPAAASPSSRSPRTSSSCPTGCASRRTSRCSTSTTRTHALIRVYDVAADGTLSNGRLFFDEIGNGVVEEGIPDGMKCDERGNIWVTGPGGVWIINARGEHLGVLEVPENVGNLAWGGSDWRTLFIPSSTSRVPHPDEGGVRPPSVPPLRRRDAWPRPTRSASTRGAPR